MLVRSREVVGWDSGREDEYDECIGFRRPFRMGEPPAPGLGYIRDTAMSHTQQRFEGTVAKVMLFLTTHVEWDGVKWTLDRHYYGRKRCDESK